MVSVLCVQSEHDIGDKLFNFNSVRVWSSRRYYQWDVAANTRPELKVSGALFRTSPSPRFFYKSSNTTIEIDTRKMFTRSLWEKKSISFYYLLGKDLFFCLKKLALFWLPPRSERTIIQRNGRRSNHDTSVARQRIRVKNPVLQSSVYRAPLEGIVTFSRRIRVISSPSLSPNLSIISNEFVHRPHRNRCFRFRFDPAAIQAGIWN